MGYTADGELADLFLEEPLLAAGRRTVDRVSADLHERVTRHTPVAKPPAASVAAEWEVARKRIPGTLRESWKIGEVTIEVDGARMTVDVYTDDPIAPHVEWDTQPHLIVPKEPTGVLRYWDSAGGTVFAKVIHHPGTKGAHMMATALVEVAATWQGIGREEMDRWSREAFRRQP